MNAVPFDTLKFAQRLEAVGLSPTAAAGIAEAFAEALTGAELATKLDISMLQHQIELLRRDLTMRLGSMMIVAVGVLLAAMRFLPPH